MEVSQLPPVRSPYRGSSSTDALAEAGTTPRLGELQSEYQRARDQTGMVQRLADAEDCRFTRWNGQTSDGLKHQEELDEGTKAMPWDASSDCRVALVDDVINSNTDLFCAAFWNARVKTEPTSINRLSAMQCGEVRAMLSWMINGPLRERLTDEVELSSQTCGTIGHAILYVGWRRVTGLQTRTLRFDAIVQQASQVPEDSVLASLPNWIADEAMADSAVETFAGMFPTLKRTRLNRVVRDLRQDGEAQFPVPTQLQNAPEILVLRPGQDVFTPPETTELTHARAIFRQVWFSQADLEAEAAAQDWDPAWVEAVKMRLGANSGSSSSGYDILNASETQNLIEVVYAYARQVDAEGVPGIWCTVFSPHVPDLAADHWMLDDAHGQYPFVALKFEATSRRLTDARGVPETFARTAQQEVKCQRDSLFNFTQISIIPPIIEVGSYSQGTPQLGPAARVKALTPTQWSWFAPPPGKPEIAFELIKAIRNDVDDYFGRYSETTHPARSQARQQRLVNRFLGAWSTAFHQALILCYQYLSADELTELLGRPPLLNATALRNQRVVFWYDVRALDAEWLEKLVSLMNQFVLTADQGAVVDRSKYVSLIMHYFDPTLAEEVTIDQQGASQAVFEKVRADVAQMALGNEALYTESDPTAAMKLKFLKQVLGTNPKYEEQRRADPRFVELLEKYEDNLMQSIMQQQNKQVGRIGVKPESYPE